MKPPGLECDDRARRRQVRAASDAKRVAGLDAVEVLTDAAGNFYLNVTFLGAAPETLTPGDFALEGGRSSEWLPRVTGVKRLETYGSDARAQLALEGKHDHSVYTLRLMPRRSHGKGRAPHVDPQYNKVDFSFDLDCPRVDCASRACCEPTVASREQPEIDYLAKDYGSFRRLMFDRLSLLVPAWKERHAADFGVMLVELLAYVGDHLSYQQDAVATEAYIGTARQRVSVRRHARLVDYELHEGCNARAWVHVAVGGGEPFSRPWDRVSFATSGAAEGAEVFLPMQVGGEAEFSVHPLLNRVKIYTWGEGSCCLSRGATSATLELPTGLLNPGDFLLFEEVLGPRTGVAADADPAHRHVVRLTRVEAVVDPVHREEKLVEVAWGAEDALPFSLCLSALGATPNCKPLHGLGVARGNVFLADHGRWSGPAEPLGTVPIEDARDVCDGPGHVADEGRVPGRFRPSLAWGPVTWRAELPPADPCRVGAEALPSAAALLHQAPRGALPVIEVFEESAYATGTVERWSPRSDLLRSGPGERHFVAEIDNLGVARLRFGDGVLGRSPEACARMTARYRVGNGPAGNVGREAITAVTLEGETLDGLTLTARNPLPARGGTPQESMEDARALVSAPLRSDIQRAVTAEDYEAVAERGVDGLQNASAELLWNGSWYEAHVALDPAGHAGADDVMLCRAARVVERARRIGHDVRVTAARSVPLKVSLTVCTKPSYLRAHVSAAVARALGTGALPDGTRGFFHPDALTFGEPVRLSRLVAKVHAVEGVVSVKVRCFERLFEGSHGEIAQGFIPLGRMEIARLDNDPRHPEHGVLDVKVEGGR